MQNNLIPRWVILFLLTAALVVASSAQTVQPALRPIAHPAARGAVHFEVRNGLFHVMDDVILTVPRLDAWMIPRDGGVVSLDDKKSFILQINAGETRLTAKDLSALLNDYLLPHAKAPLKNMTLRFEGSEVVIHGDLHKVVDIPFEGRGTVAIGDDEDIRVHFTQLKVAGLVKKGVLDALGIKLAAVAQPRKQSRFYIEGDDIVLPITALFPPPRVTGKLTAVSIQGDSLVQIFGPPNASVQPPPTAAANFIYFRGGRIRFGKLTMDDVDLQLIDKEPSNGFDFSLDHYAEQLQAGYTKCLASRGLLAYVPDYATVAKAAHEPDHKD